jgi:hypothetical protein
MPVSGGGFTQAYNVQAAVDTDTMLVMATGSPRRPTTSGRWSRCWQPWRRCRTRWAGSKAR